MDIEKSLLLTFETYSGAILSNAKIHLLFVYYKVDKEKVSDWFGIADLFRPIHTNNPKLDSAAKVIKIFQNPNVGQAYMIGNRKIISSIYMK
jgi:hypothetical protein